MNNLRQKSLSGFSWSFLRLFTVQMTGFIVQLILARVLLPEVFGLIAMLQLFISLGQTLMDSGMTSSLIRTKDADQSDFSTVFYLNLLISIIVYALIFTFSKAIGDFYHQPALELIVKVYGLSVIIQGLIAVQLAKITKEMNFKLQMKLEIPSVLISCSVGVWMAYNGYGVWSLVWMYLLKSILFTVQVWFFAKWTPSLVFDVSKLKKHFNFGYKLTLSSIINTVYDNIYTIIIGRYFSILQLGFYDRANTLRLVPIQTLSTALGNVTYPLFSSIQDDDERLRKTYKKVMQQVIFVVAPLMLLAALIAEPLFRLILTDKWLPSVPYFQILCAASILYPLHAYNLNILNVKGRSDLFLKLEIVKKALITISVFIVIPFGILGLIYMQLVLNVLMFFINTFYSGMLIKYNTLNQIKDILPAISSAIFALLVMIAVNVYILKGFNLLDINQIAINSFLYLVIYLALASIFKFPALGEIKQIIFKRL